MRQVKRCTVAHCTRKHRAKGLCAHHYERKRKGLPIGEQAEAPGAVADTPAMVNEQDTRTPRIAQTARRQLAHFLAQQENGSGHLTASDFQKIASALEKLHKIEQESAETIQLSAVDSLLVAVGQAIQAVLMDPHVPREVLVTRLSERLSVVQREWQEKLG